MPTTQLSSDFLNSFEIAEVLEQKPRSGQKQVYIVKRHGIITALKIIPSVDERILREIRICDEFKDNRGIPNILHVSEYEKELILFEEYIDGHCLADIIETYLNDSLKVRTLIFNIAAILKQIWENEYIHRDLKPQNIIIRHDGSPVVLDFGIARDLDEDTITPSGFQPYSWPCVSPEQLFYRKNQISYRTDFFCLGIIAYILYTGKLPFGSKTNTAELYNQEQVTFDVGDSEMNLFLNSVLRFKVAERPRNFNAFIKSLSL